MRSGASAKKSIPLSGLDRMSLGTPAILDSKASGTSFITASSRTVSRYSVTPYSAASRSLCTTSMSHEPVILAAGTSRDFTMFFVMVEPGIPVISDRKPDENIIRGEIDVTAALSCVRVHVPLFTYTHQTNARIWPRSAGV